MIKLGEADSVLLADQSLAAAQAAAQRVNRLLNSDKAHPAELDVTDHNAVVAALTGIDAFLSAVPYYHNLGIARAAVQARASMCDLGREHRSRPRAVGARPGGSGSRNQHNP